jgi:tRNA/rRNA methyltransferase
MKKIAIILIGTQLPENLGSVARIMGNFELKDLRLVKPQINFLHPQAIATSVSSRSILENCQIFETLKDASKDLDFLFATSAGTRDMIKPYKDPKQATTFLKENNFKNIGFVFGCEKSGLNNEDLSLCQSIITIPTSSLSSLNLSHAVGIVAYECYKNLTYNNHINQLRIGTTQFANQENINFFFNKLEKILDEKNFWRKKDKKTIMWRNLRNCFLRITPTEQEIRTLNGMIDYITKK